MGADVSNCSSPCLNRKHPARDSCVKSSLDSLASAASARRRLSIDLAILETLSGPEKRHSSGKSWNSKRQRRVSNQQIVMKIEKVFAILRASLSSRSRNEQNKQNCRKSRENPRTHSNESLNFKFLVQLLVISSSSQRKLIELRMSTLEPLKLLQGDFDCAKLSMDEV